MTVVDLVTTALVGKTIKVGGKDSRVGKVTAVTWMAEEYGDEFLALQVEGPKKVLTLDFTEEFEILEAPNDKVEN